ncbi:MAG: SCO family protein [Acidobacteria bacterium]|nr:SCO family protein [Acidobacteriota bacterium]MBI3280344.1 SCO family protein [Acidobacteriota bacterium]
MTLTTASATARTQTQANHKGKTTMWAGPAVVRGAVLLLFAAGCTFAQDAVPAPLQGVGIDEKLGQKIDLDLQFTAENGYQVPLRSFFKGKPVILNLVYYTCPMLCNLILNGQVDGLRELAWTPGNEFEIVTISIDPADNFALAQKKKGFYLEAYGKPTAGWHFLTDYQENVKKLADQVGFRYRWDETQEQFAHVAAIMVLSPDGMVSRYLYGIKYRARDLRLGLAEASEGKLGVTERLLLFCFHYDPQSRSYVPFAENFMRAGGVLVLLVFGSILFRLWRRERRISRAASPPENVVPAK